jgi:hypothetical protein
MPVGTKPQVAPPSPSTVAAVFPVTFALSALIDRATETLANARTCAQILDARDQAQVAYDAAKSAARLAKLKNAHTHVIRAVHQMQADALLIESNAKRRLAEEYEAAQDRGEVSVQGQHGDHVPGENMKATVTDIGLTRKEVHDARQVRDAEAADPGVVARTVNEALDAGEEPTKAKVRKAVKAAGGTEYKLKLTRASKSKADADDHDDATADNIVNKLKSENRDLKEKLRAAKAAHGTIGELARHDAQREIDWLKAKIETLSVNPDAAMAETIRKLELDLQNATTEINTLKKEKADLAEKLQRQKDAHQDFKRSIH